LFFCFEIGSSSVAQPVSSQWQSPELWLQEWATTCHKDFEISRAWWRTPLIPALGRQRQADFWVWGQPGPQSEFQDSQGYTEKPCLEKPKKKKKILKSRYVRKETDLRVWPDIDMSDLFGVFAFKGN
jgi:hypothetical protein